MISTSQHIFAQKGSYLTGTEDYSIYYLYIPGATNTKYQSTGYGYGAQSGYTNATCRRWSGYITIENHTGRTLDFFGNVTVSGAGGRVCTDEVTYPIRGSVGPKSSIKVRLGDGQKDFWTDIDYRLGTPGIDFPKWSYRQ